MKWLRNWLFSRPERSNRVARGRRWPTPFRTIHLEFELLEDRVQPAQIVFTNTLGGSWHTATNWNLIRIPEAGDDVVIPDLPGNQTITFGSGSTTVNSVSVAENLVLSGGTLALTGSVQVTGSFQLRGGTLSGATLASGTLTLTANGGTLTGGVTVAAGATLDATQNVAGSNAWANVTGGLTLDGPALLGTPAGGTSGQLYFYGTQALGGSGGVTLGASGSNGMWAVGNGGNAPATLTVGGGIEVGGGSGSVRGYYANDSLVNAGAISVPAGRTLALGGAGWVNAGTVAADPGATADLHGSVSVAGLGAFAAAGATVNLWGTLQNANATLALTPSVGNWYLRGGTVSGGAIAGGTLTLTANAGTLAGGVVIAAGATLDATQNVGGSSAWAAVTGGLTLDGEARLGNPAGTVGGGLNFHGTQALGGAGAVTFGSGGNNAVYAIGNNGNTPATLTVGSGVTVGGGSGTVSGYYANDSLVNHGAISVPAGRTLALGGANWVNAGAVAAAAGAVVDLYGSVSVAGMGNFQAAGAAVHLRGTLQNANATLALTPSVGNWYLRGGTVSGGAIAGGTLTLTANAGTLAGGVVIAAGATLDATQNVGGSSAWAAVTGGLTLDGEARLGNPAGTVGGGLNFHGTQALGGAGAVTFGSGGNNAVYAIGNNGNAPATLTVGGGIEVGGGSGSVRGYYANDSLVNAGAISVPAGRTLALGGAGWVNAGTVAADPGATSDLHGSFTVAGMGSFTAAGAAVHLRGTLQNANATLALTPSVGNWYLRGGTVSGGAIAGGTLTLTANGGQLVGVTVAAGAALDATQNVAGSNGYANVTGGLTLDGEARLGNPAGTTSGQLYFYGTQALGGAGGVALGASGSNALYAVGNNGNAPAALAVGVPVGGGSGIVSGYYANDSLVNNSVITASSSGGVITLGGTPFTNNGTLSAVSGGMFAFASAFTAGGQAVLIVTPAGTARFAGNLLSTVTNPSQFGLQGAVVFNGGGNATTPRLLEVTSQDLGTALAGFAAGNFAIGALSVTNNTYLKLVDQADNAPGATAEAVYANSVVVAAGSTLDLNGKKVFTRALQQGGTVINGEITVIADSGPLVLGTPTPGAINPAGQFDEWTVFLRAGRAVTVRLNPGAAGPNPPVAPVLNWARVQLLDPANAVLATATNTTAGGLLVLDNVAVPADGVYTVRVTAAPAFPASMHNYTVTAWDTTATVRPLDLNQITSGALVTPFAADRWTFAATAGQQVQFDLLGASGAGLRFDLVGPNGYLAFTDLSGDSPLVTLLANGTYALTARSPVGATGSYTFVMRQTTVTAITLGTPHTGSLVASGQPHLYRFDVPNPQVLTVALTDAATTGRTELYARYGLPPTRESYDYAATGPGRSQSLFVPSASPGTWYVLVYGESVPAAGSYTLLARGAAARVTGVFPTAAGSTAPATLTVSGAGFTAGTTVALIASDGTAYTPSSYSVDLFTQLTATFPSGLPVGTYSVRVTNAGNTDILPNAFAVTAGGQARLETNLILPRVLGRHAVDTLYVEYANTGDVAMPAPLLSLQSADANDSDKPVLTLDPNRIVQNFWSTGLPPGTGHTALILAGGRQPGWLHPGERIRVPVYYLGLLQPWDNSDTAIELEIRYWTEADTTAIDWPSRQEALRPPTLSAEQWAAVYANLTSGIPTTGDYVRMLNQNARYLGELGQNVVSVDDLWNFEVQQAYGYTAVPTLDSVVDAAMPTPGLSLDFARRFGNSIQSRYDDGPLGRGWFTPWQMRLFNTGNGELIQTISVGGSARTFQRDRRTGTYFSGVGDSGTLTSLGNGVFELRAVTGTATRFRADGKIDYVQDTNGNRITATYTALGRLDKLTHSNGASLSFAYTPAGLYSSVTDSAGRVTTYLYDPSNTYLVAVLSPDGKMTKYDYQRSGAPEVLHAMLWVERGGTRQTFTYDARGRLDTSFLTGNAQFVDYAYTDTGLVTVTDAAGATSLYFDHRGLLAKVRDPLGHLTSNEFNSDLRLSRTVSPTGESQSFTWCSCGSMTSVTNELGQTTSFAYDHPLKRMTSFTDARGNTTRYTYDANGNLLTTVYPNGSVESLSGYTTAGLPGVSTNRRGQPLSYQYNAAGQVTRQTFADTTFITFAYDARGNLTTVTDGPEVTTYEYDFENDGDRLKKITYPNGRYLEYSYDGFGRRTRMTDQDNYQTRYEYDTDTGRLYRLRDASDTLLVTYTYDASGRLSRVDKGNGTFTTYEYDAAGQLLSLKNWRNTTTLNSKFDYTYDARGRRVTMATLDGTWTYGYDPTGQLTRAVFASLDTAVIPNQDLQYFYDAAGNRTKTILNGVTTIYAANNLNQYTTVGGVGQTHDAEGNLTFDGVNTYTYDQQSRLTRVSGPQGVTEYEYDAFGNRVAKVENGTRTEYLNDPSGLTNVTAEFGAGNTRQATYLHGAGLVGQLTASTWNYYDFDALGSTAGITKAAGSYVNRYMYDPTGGTILSTGTLSNAFQFVGQFGVTAEANGLSYMRARFHDTSTNRFTAIDPIRISGGINLYRYSSNNSVNIIDPFGLFDISNNPEDCKDAEEAGGSFVGGYFAFGFGTMLGGPILGGFLSMVGAEYGGLAGSANARRVCPQPTGSSQPAQPAEPAQCIPQLPPWVPPDPDIPNLPTCPPPKYVITPPPSLTGGTPTNNGNPFLSWPWDPNQKLPGLGYGPLAFVAAGAAIPYRIDFENYGPGSVDENGDPVDPARWATAPAQYVTVSDFLSADFDWSTFRLTEFGFGDERIAVPVNAMVFQTTRRMTYNAKTFDVLVEAGIRLDTGEVYASFLSLDPATGLPPDVLTGFLPPEDGTGRGMGFFSYTIRPVAALPTGREIRNVALISFDQQLGIRTDQVDPLDPSQGYDPNRQARVTIDAGLPTSSVAALPATSTTAAFPVSWAGADDAGGSGIAGYDVYVSVNGGAYTLWQTNTTATSATFTGAMGNTYRFYSVATDNTGQRQPTPTAAQATTQLLDPRAVVIGLASSLPAGSTYGQSVTFTATVAPQQTGNPTPTGTVQFRADGVNVGGPVPLVNGVAALSSSLLNAGSRGITAVFTSDTGTYDGNTSLPLTQTVARVTLTVTADNKTKVAGDPLPTLTATYSGFVNGEGPAVLSGTPALSVPANLVNTAGTHVITAAAGTLYATNYAFQLVNGSLTVTPGVPAVVATVGGSPQVTLFGTAFATPLRAVVQDAYGNPLSGQTVTFTAPASGASGTFPGGFTVATAITDAAGVATAPVFTAGPTVGAYTVVASIPAPASAAYTLTNRGPVVLDVQVNGGEVQRSRVTTLTVTFDSAVTVAAGAFTVAGVSPTGTPLTGAAVAFTTAVVNGRTVATLTISGANTEFGSLADGTWTLTVDRTGVTLGGVPMDADYTSAAAGVRIRRLYGDITGDGQVNGQDAGFFDRAFGTVFGQPAFVAGFDWNNDGQINGQDAGLFDRRFGTVLPP